MSMFTEEDIKQFSEKGIDEKTVERQLDLFKTGFPFKKLYAAASAERVFQNIARVSAPRM